MFQMMKGKNKFKRILFGINIFPFLRFKLKNVDDPNLKKHFIKNGIDNYVKNENNYNVAEQDGTWKKTSIDGSSQGPSIKVHSFIFFFLKILKFCFQKNSPEFKPSFSANAPIFNPQPQTYVQNNVPFAPAPQQSPFINNYAYGYSQPMQPMGFFNNMNYDYMGNSYMGNVIDNLIYLLYFIFFTLVYATSTAQSKKIQPKQINATCKFEEKLKIKSLLS